MHIAVKAAEHDDRTRAIRWIGITALLGLVFLSNQALEYAQADFRISSHAYGSVFYLMTGFHGLHVIGGLLFMLAVVFAIAGRTSRAPSAAIVGGVWLLLALRRRRLGRDVRHDLPAEVTDARRDALLVAGLVFAAATALVFLLAATGGRERRQAGPGQGAVRHRLFELPWRRWQGRDRPPTARCGGHRWSIRVKRLRSTSCPRAGCRWPTRMTSPPASAPCTTTSEIAALVAYVGAFGDGPKLPKVNVDNADLAAGGEVYRGNCAPCHSASGSGGALSYGRAAPALSDATPEQVGAAVRSGPGQMPVFGADQLSNKELNNVAAYVQYLRHPEDPGGLAIGHIGPVPEGFVAWFFGVTALLLVVAWIGTRSPFRRPGSAEERRGRERP